MNGMRAMMVCCATKPVCVGGGVGGRGVCACVCVYVSVCLCLCLCGLDAWVDRGVYVCVYVCAVLWQTGALVEGREDTGHPHTHMHTHGNQEPPRARARRSVPTEKQQTLEGKQHIPQRRRVFLSTISKGESDLASSPAFPPLKASTLGNPTHPQTRTPSHKKKAATRIH